LELAPEVIQPVLDRRAREGDPEFSAQAVSRPGDLGVGVLDDVGLVEDVGVPLHGAELFLIMAQD
jgi:hypothetical protein